MKQLPSILAGLIALGACLAAAWASQAVFERMPHLEDEFDNLWQAEVMAEGEIALPSPDFPRSFMVPFVVDYGGLRFGKYPPGWPALAIALLFVQANADLAVPDYLSKIVNYGIQQGGVENAVPAAIRKIELEKLSLFRSIDERELILSNYTLVNPDSADFAAFVDLYPTLANEPIYVLNQVDKAVIEKMNPAMGKAWLVVASIKQIINDPTKAAGMGQALGIDLTQIPAGSDLFTILKNLPQSQILSITNANNQ